jgi:hypothetical protein
MGDQLVLWQGSHEDVRHPDFRYDPAARAWHRLPDSPLGDGFDRSMVWTGRELVLADHELVPDPGSERPSLTRLAVLDPAAGTWRRLPDAQQLATSPWLVEGGRLVNPQLGGEDGGQVGNWGRTVAYGGIVDVASGAWSPLPDAPVTEAQGSAYGTTGAVWSGGAGPALDARKGAWQKIPRLPQGDVSEHTVVAVGNRMLVFGGARWPDSGRGELIAATWLWTPPA